MKIQGHRLELAEIESALLDHESIAECAVLAVTGTNGIVTKLVAYVVARDEPRPAQWRAQMRRRFGDVMLPMIFRTVPRALPRNETGKVDRRLLAQFSQQPAHPADSCDGSSEMRCREHGCLSRT